MNQRAAISTQTGGAFTTTRDLKEAIAPVLELGRTDQKMEGSSLNVSLIPEVEMISRYDIVTLDHLYCTWTIVDSRRDRL
ncbi:hypothetical protein SPBR_02149 [Sporothrix brasiliensis 5110]|uniref:Uncharacterized protein n=1 Tax=Sporothrix brasiliensis 5110 TaxID=1398154 RepID=A0A0C2J2N4_9PEZI|nr:uncharacterized protein SPBR_02149 [Sporothrix brasiliensis 5110]KIH91347.1 hypothetical protein SPBR_02149 [Sporothrix brasiliensis 5110]